MRSLLAGLAAGLACLAPAGAFAQDPQPSNEDPALWCVYEALNANFDYEVVAEAYLYDEDLTGDPDGVLSKAGMTCAQTHGLNEAQQFATMEYARFGAVIDYLTEELMFDGVTDEQITAVFLTVDILSDDDYESLYDEGWESTDVATRVKAELLKAQFPTDDLSIGTALQIMGLIARADEAEFVYQVAGGKIQADNN